MGSAAPQCCCAHLSNQRSTNIVGTPVCPLKTHWYTHTELCPRCSSIEPNTATCGAAGIVMMGANIVVICLAMSLLVLAAGEKRKKGGCRAAL